SLASAPFRFVGFTLAPIIHDFLANHASFRFIGNICATGHYPSHQDNSDWLSSFRLALHERIQTNPCASHLNWQSPNIRRHVYVQSMSVSGGGAGSMGVR